MNLLPQVLLERFETVGKQDHPNPIVLARFFHAPTGWEWYPTEYDPFSQMFYGWISGDDVTLGFFTLEELDDLMIFDGAEVERDLDWNEMRLMDVKAYAQG